MKPGIDEVADFLRARISRRTRVPEAEIFEATVLVDIGLESVDAVLICGEIEDAFQVEVEPALMFEHESFGAVLGAVMALFEER